MSEKFSSETLAPVLVPLIVDKLPKRVVEKWELEIGDHKEDYVIVKNIVCLLRTVNKSQGVFLASLSSIKVPCTGKQLESWSPFQV